MRWRGLVLGVGLGALLAGALYLSRVLTADEAPAGSSGPPRFDEPRPPAERASPPRAEVPVGVPSEGAPAGEARAPPAFPGATVEVAESPFQTEKSAELDYAVTLIFGRDAGPDTWRNAAEVFERCLKQVPSNERCYRGMEAAQRRLRGEDAGTAEALEARAPAEDDGQTPRMLGVPTVPAKRR